MTLVFPAPLGPSRPSTSPRATVKETSSTAVWRPYRLRSPEHQTAGDGGRPASPAAADPAAAVSEVIPWTVAASAEATGDRQELVGAQRTGDSGHDAVLDPDHAGEEPVAGGEHGRGGAVDVGLGGGHQLGGHGQRECRGVLREVAQLVRETVGQ